MMCNNPKLDIVNMNAYIKFGKFCQFVLKIMSGNGIMTHEMTELRTEGRRLLHLDSCWVLTELGISEI